MIDPDHERLSIRRQCELVSIYWASFYRQPAGETPENLELSALSTRPSWKPLGMAPGRWRGICAVKVGVSAANGSGG